MQFVLLAVIIGALLYLARYFPKTGFTLLGFLVIGAIVIVLTSTDFGDHARSKVPPDHIVIENPVMIKGYGGGYRFSARLGNNHPSKSILESNISITMKDCVNADSENCIVIGQSDVRINITIPPSQARDVSRTISFDAAQPKGTVKWQYKVTRTRS